ncbi:hypothetical protein M9H77_28716 [Catharanthus roseus]|uniref:Uncharacterized protein n=1 Tax=Catharanthus roseus TaxID=4058 RepID=A0ACC0AG58_CATRO|nr:hypothetical protein M9H77_28716 [Catharanthus roseus]
MASEIGISVAAKVAEYLVAPIGRPFGYLFLFNSNLKNLQEQIAQLEYMRVVVQRQVDAAKRNVEVIRPSVEAWLAEVDKTKSDSEEIFEQVRKIGTSCFRAWCLHARSRHSLSRRAKMLGEVALDIQGRGKFDRVADPIPITCLPTISSGDFKTFESRNLVIKEIMVALQDDEISMIGICGMGGTGKTMLVKEVSQKAKDEHMFDEVALAVVSQNLNVREIQDQLADRLGLSFPEETISVRAQRLHARLIMNNNKKILVILDDVWRDIDLREIGIPVGGNRNGCKIVFTSRIQLEFDIRGTQRNFPIDVLSEEEAWDFFKEIVGNSVDNPDLQVVARKVAEECGRLPLAIRTLGCALRNKRVHDWEDAFTQLQGHIVTNISGMHTKVYSSIRLSYSYLESKQAKSLLILCSLFPEDYDIPIEILVRYGKGLCLFSDIDSLLETRNRVHSLIGELRSCSLLLAGNKEGSVKMHDVVRDVVISIASFGDHRLKQLQFVNEGKSGTAISLNINEFDKLPADLYSPPNLQLFQLKRIFRFAVDIPDNFFEGMKELRVIDLTGLSLNLLLPSSFCFLSSLCTLCLDYCTLQTDLSIIGSLKQLEVLSFFCSQLEELPGEVRELRKLKLLDLRCRKGPRTIPSGVFSELINLEELYIGKFRDWEEAGYPGNARIRELNSLSSLKVLQMRPSSCDVISELTQFPFEKLIKFSISESYGFSESYDFDNSLILLKEGTRSSDMNVLRKTKIISLLKRAVFVELECEGWIRNPLCELCQENTLLNMRELRLHNYSEDCLINLSNENDYGNANASSSSTVKSCSWRGPILQPSWLQNLNVLRLYRCNSVKVVFPHCVVVCMAQLRKLIIWYSEKMEHIVGNEEEHNDDDNRVEFPKLESLILSGMPVFRSFYSAFDPEDTARNTLFNHQVIFPCLEKVDIFHMKNLTQVVDGQMLSCSLCKVREMWVSQCENLLVVSASDMGILKTLYVKHCESLEAVFSFEGNQATLGQLNYLTLQNLPKLVEIWRIPPLGNGTCQNLRSLSVENCENLRFLLPLHVAKMLVKIQYISIKQCETMEGVIETDREEVDDDNAEPALFPDLETLDLEGLPMLEMFCSGPYISKWPALRTLGIVDCPKLKKFYGKKRKISDAKSIGTLETSNLNSYAASFFHQKDGHMDTGPE